MWSQTTDSKQAMTARWDVYRQIAAQAKDHSQFDALMETARQATAEDEMAEYDTRL